MKKNKKNIDDQAKEIIRYLEDKMTPAERNSFEKKLQSDPFLAEAVEGYSFNDYVEVEDDINELKKKLRSRTRSRSTLLYRVAAAVVVLFGISSVLLVKNLRRTDLKIAENRSIEPGEIQQMPVPEYRPGIHVLGEEPVIGKQELKELPEGKAIAELYEISVDSATDDQIMMAEEEEPVMTGKGEMAKDLALEEIPAKQKEAEAAERVAGVIARKETIMKKVRLDEDAAAQVEANIISREAQPAIGKDEYNRYLEDEQVYPAGYQKSGLVEVILELIIQEDGSIGEIEVQESPDKPFSDEAIRLIKDGPLWLPAIKGGEAIKDTVNLKILFKRKD